MNLIQRLCTWLTVAALGAAVAVTHAADSRAAAGISCTNIVVADVPWSIHVVKIPRAGNFYEIQSRHADGHALGMSTLSDQIALTNPVTGTAVAAVNGGFYFWNNGRKNPYTGSPRGLQVVEGEVISAPAGNAGWWVDFAGEPHLTAVASQFAITWPDGRTTPFGLNCARAATNVTLYTPAAGASTYTTNGLELVLEQKDGGPWLPLRVGRKYPARVREVRQGGDTALASNIMILSVGPGVMEQFKEIKAGDGLQISTATSPALPGLKAALSAGPALVIDGKQQKIKPSSSDQYQFSSMLERHPRTAIGWNDSWFYLVEVDGRQKELSVGMTLDELSEFLVKQGCKQALNLDGGGSSTLWFDGSVRNSPCDGHERVIANSLVVVQKSPKVRAKAEEVAQP